MNRQVTGGTLTAAALKEDRTTLGNPLGSAKQRDSRTTSHGDNPVGALFQSTNKADGTDDP